MRSVSTGRNAQQCMPAEQGTYRNQSTAMISVMSSVGSPTDVSTITIVTSPAWGIPAAPMLAAVAVMLEGTGKQSYQQRQEKRWSHLQKCHEVAQTHHQLIIILAAFLPWSPRPCVVTHGTSTQHQAAPARHPLITDCTPQLFLRPGHSRGAQVEPQRHDVHMCFDTWSCSTTLLSCTFFSLLSLLRKRGI